MAQGKLRSRLSSNTALLNTPITRGSEAAIGEECKHRGRQKHKLYLVAQNGHLEVEELLLERGANIEAAEVTGENIALRSAQDEHLEVVGLLLEKVEAKKLTRCAKRNGYSEAEGVPTERSWQKLGLQ
ncbi:hypothetical protein EV426DRAFT_708830 [Tirmania nivea]|nr:hypothetical protein EV426DRAFT_708830 [Tirmania nivea]